MSLPGGVLVDGQLHRGFSFRPVTGELELKLAESAQQEKSHAARITTVLCEALETVGDVPASAAVVRALSVGDRQYLMAQLAAHIDYLPVWLTACCGVCQEPFDVSYSHSALPVKRAGENYSRVRMNTSLGPVDVHVPTGADQERIAMASDDVGAMEVLLSCIVSGVDTDSEFDSVDLNAADIASIEKRVEEMAPEIATDLLAECPSCGIENKVAVNLYSCLERALGELFSDIHVIASHYYWSERDILSMPRGHRQVYLRLIDLSRGMHQPADFIQTT